MPATLLRMTGIAKHFGGEQALDGIDFELRAGEIHALLGENGAGKSTLIKILAGVVSRDAGEILVSDQAMSASLSAAGIREAGVAFVHQDLGLAEHLSVAENIALAVGYRTKRGLISFRQTSKHVALILDDLGLAVSPDALVGDLSQDEKVMVAVARAFSLSAKAIVLDEISSSLPGPEVARLARSLRQAKKRGTGYVYVTHRLDEVFSFADRLTVLRDGRKVVTTDVADVTYEQVVEWITGASGTTPLPPRSDGPETDADVRLRVLALSGPGMHEPMSFSARKGEVVALCGLVGCGARDVAAMLGGAEPPTSGKATLDGVQLPLGSPRKLRARGCTYVPGDRQGEGGLLGLSIRENLFLTRAGGGEDGVLRRPVPERRSALSLVNRFGVRPSGLVDRPLSSLSGGNQQKVVCGRALRNGAALLVLDDPTAGVDVHSRAQLHSIIRDATQAGTTVVFASTDFDEVASEADRALVLWNGRVHAELKGDDLTPERIAQACYGTYEKSEENPRDDR